MALTESNKLKLGTKAPDFSLTDSISKEELSLEQCKGTKATIISFICNHCPYVKHINLEIVKIANDYYSKGIKMIAISSNDVENYPEDHPDLMKENATKYNFSFPYLYDENQDVAKLYDAACTPDFYIYDSDLKLVYHGQLDDSRPGNGIPVSGKDIRQALEAIVTDKKVSLIQKPSIGCNIKWKN